LVKPAPPNITEPLSVCSRRVRLDGLVQDATVALRGGAGRELGKWTATWPDQLFDLDPGTVLQPGELLSTMQEGPDGASGWSTAPLSVQSASPSTPLIDYPVVACAQTVVATAVAPGSLVTVMDKATNMPLGTSAGGVRETVRLSRPLSLSDRIELHATPCGGAAGVASAEPRVELLQTLAPGDRRLPPVQLVLPLRACQRLIEVQGAQPGTTFVIERGDGSRVTWPIVSGAPATLRIDPLKETENISWWVTPGDISCDVLDSDGDFAVVTKDKPPQPKILSTPCPGSPELSLGDLLPSATVQLLVDGVPVLETVAAATAQPLSLGDVELALRQRLTIQQRLCNDWSDPSPAVEVTKPWDLKPAITLPLVDCAATVVVTGVSPGAMVLVLDDTLDGGELGREIAIGTSVAVAVTPTLKDTHTIVVKVLGCHPVDLKALVDGVVEVKMPTLEQAFVGTRTIVVGAVAAGTTVDVDVNGHHVAGAIAVTETVDVTVPHPLRETDTIEVFARRCDRQRQSGPKSPSTAPVPAYTLWGAGGLDLRDGNWASGRVESILALPGGLLVLGCTESGVWISHPDGSAEPVGFGWPGASVRALASDPANPLHMFAATAGGLRETDPAAADPVHTWRDVPLHPRAKGDLKAVVVTGDRVLVVADSAGLFWSPIPAPGAAWSFTTDLADPLAARFCTGAAAVTGGVTAFASSTPKAGAVSAQPVALLRGEWSAAAGTFTWTDHAGTAPAVFTSRMDRTVLASAPSDRNHVYALSADASVTDPATRTVLGVLHSPDAGRTWTCPYLGLDPTLTGFQLDKPWDLGQQASDDSAIVVHPFDPNKVVVAGRNQHLITSNDGCSTFTPGPRITDKTFHADTRCLTYDIVNGPPHILVGGDGGVFIGQDETGTAFDTSRNRGPSTLMVDEDQAPSIASSPDIPGSCAIGLRDNGEASIVPGTPWRQSLGGDGERQVAIFGSYIFHNDNDEAPLQWSQFTVTGLGPNHEVVRPAAVGNEPRPTLQSQLAAVRFPTWTNSAGNLLVAYAAEPFGPASAPKLYGIFYDPAAGDGRFAAEFLAELSGIPTGLASYDGRTAIVCTQSLRDAFPRLYRFDAATQTLLESALPPKLASDGDELRFPVLSGPRSGAVLLQGTLLTSEDLQSWTQVPDIWGARVIAVDDAEHPPALHVGTDSTVSILRDGGILVTTGAGLPANPHPTQMTVVTDALGDRWIYLGTFGWSVWRAKLS
jgi:hypothetical protein